jgi:hypothetical protein
MRNLGLQSLTRTGGPHIVLADDGIGFDAHKDDGIYTGVFNAAQVEGSYTFVFRARGRNSADVVFDRSETRSVYVRFAPSPQATTMDVIGVVAGQDDATQTTTIRVVPRNDRGDYLGPFMADRITLWSGVGDVLPEVVDHRDGSYSFRLVSPRGVIPEISVAVEDQIVVDRQPATPQSPWKIWWLLILLLAILVVLVLLVWWIRRP